MEETCASETSADFQRTAQCYVPKDRTLHNHRSYPTSDCYTPQFFNTSCHSTLITDLQNI
jgi:hypothetical protein